MSKENPKGAYSRALCLESLGLRGKFNPQTETFYNVMFDDFEKFARIVVYKVANNLKRGKQMDVEANPLK